MVVRQLWWRQRQRTVPSIPAAPVGGSTGSKAASRETSHSRKDGAQEAQLQKLLQELEEQRSRADQAEATAEERKAALEAALQAAEQLKAIDPLFLQRRRDATVSHRPNADGCGMECWERYKSTAEVIKEQKVEYEIGGDGRADYVLDDEKREKRLAVIEANVR